MNYNEMVSKKLTDSINEALRRSIECVLEKAEVGNEIHINVKILLKDLEEKSHEKIK